MISILVHALEITIIGLLGYLTYTMYVLSKTNGHQSIACAAPFLSKTPLKKTVTSAPLSHSYSRAESITSAQIFAGLQLLEVKRKGINLNSTNEDWLNNGISFYLLGAASAITEHFDCRGSEKDDVMKFLLTKNLKQSDAKAEQYISELYQLNEQSINEERTEDSAFDAGISAAKTWLKNKFIPEEYSLLSNLHTWGFIA